MSSCDRFGQHQRDWLNMSAFEIWLVAYRQSGERDQIKNGAYPAALRRAFVRQACEQHAGLCPLPTGCKQHAHPDPTPRQPCPTSPSHFHPTRASRAGPSRPHMTLMEGPARRSSPSCRPAASKARGCLGPIKVLICGELSCVKDDSESHSMARIIIAQVPACGMSCELGGERSELL